MQIHIVSHTHWDREWYLTYEQFRLRLVGLIDRLLDLMEARPDFEYFHLDGQTIVLEDYLELRPHQEARLRRLVANGRLLIGPWYDMPDEFLVSGESLVRNLARGHRLAAQFGTPMPVGYLPDLFGHVGQMPQILRQFGLDNAILWRGFGGPRAEYWWQAPDGSRVLMMHLPPEGYCNATRVHLDPERMVERTADVIATEAARTAVGQVLLMNGVDHVEPHPVIPELARRLTAKLGSPVRHSTLPAYVDAVRDAVTRNGVALEVIRGELRGGEEYANLLPGVFSARVYIKQANARIQTLLEKRAEPLASAAWMLGAAYPADELRYAWRTLLQNHPHDSICGCSIDAVHDENMTRFARAEQVARALVDRSAVAIADALPAGGAGTVRVVALNTTGTSSTQTIEATIDLPYASAEPRRHVDQQALDHPVTFWPQDASVMSVTTHDGRTLPFQLTAEEDVVTFVMMRYDTPWALQARRLHLLWQGDVPPWGYATFDLGIGQAEPARRASSTDSRIAENALVRVTVNHDGTVDIIDKRTGTQYARCGEIEDMGDVGDEYNYSPPAHDRRVTSAEAQNVRITQVLDGPIRTALRIDYDLALPAAASADRSARAVDMAMSAVSLVVSIDEGSARVGWRISIDNRSLDHRVRLLFPTGVASIADVRAETAFGVARRPARRAVPAQVRVEMPMSYGPTGSFTEAGNDQTGAVVFGEGLAEYEAVAGPDGGTSHLALTLLRAVGFLSREDLVTRPSGHAGPGLATPGAQCVGRHTFRVAFEPRGAAPSNTALFAWASSFVAPPLVVPVIGTAPRLPPTGRFLTVAPREGGVVVSACHRAEDADALLVRVFNADDTPSRVQIGAHDPVRQATLVDFLERPLEAMMVRDGQVELNLAPHRIATLLLRTEATGAE